MARLEEPHATQHAQTLHVPPGGGPPPHLHEREQECFCLLDGRLTMTIGDRQVQVSAGDFVQIPREVVHTFTNDGTEPVRMRAIFAPAGMEHWMTRTFDPALDRAAPPPPATPAPIARMVAAAPEHGVRFS